MKLQLTGKEMKFVESRPARALWIEIHKAAAVLNKVLVEAREGLVD